MILISTRGFTGFVTVVVKTDDAECSRWGGAVRQWGARRGVQRDGPFWKARVLRT